MFERFTQSAIKVILLAQEEARRLKQNFVGTEQVLLGIIGEGTSKAAKLLGEQGVNLKKARIEVEKIIGRGASYVPAEIPLTPRAKAIFDTALHKSGEFGHNFIAPEHILLSLLDDAKGVSAKVLNNMGVDSNKLRNQLIKTLGEIAAVAAGPSGTNRKDTITLTLDEFSTNLTKLAAEGKLDAVVGREKEIERIVQILGRRTKNNPVLVGEPGVGKTAIAEGLAQRIFNKNVPDNLEDKQVYSLDMGSLLAGTRFRGEFEERIKNIMQEISNAGNIILFIDEIHTLIGAGASEGGMDAANILKPALSRGQFQCLGATTLDEYRKHIERDAALERRFQPVKVGEPSVEETIQILYGLRQAYEQHHKLKISDEALVSAAQLSHRYISDRFLPDKAIDLIDEAGSRVRFSNTKQSPELRSLKQELPKIVKEKEAAVRDQDFEKAGKLRDKELEIQGRIATASQNKTQTIDAIVTSEDIAEIVASWTGVPVSKLTETESEMLLHIEDTLHQRLIGQEEAVKAVSRAIRRARVGLKNPNRPIASFLFSGPTGVGKTELTKALAAYFFGSEKAMIRLDMSEYMERHTISKLIGSPPGYIGFDEGGQLTEAVRRRPYTVVLFDEIEKAHPDVFNMLLQLLEDGRLTDAKGRTVSFKNTLIILTSNIGSQVISKGGNSFGFELSEAQGEAQYQRICSLVNDELKRIFRPEFLNRLDETIVFRPLIKDELKDIVEIMLREVFNRLSEQGIKPQVTDKFKERLIQENYDPAYGARPLRRAIMRLLEDVLAEAILAGNIKDGDSVLVDIDETGNPKIMPVFEKVPELALRI